MINWPVRIMAATLIVAGLVLPTACNHCNELAQLPKQREAQAIRAIVGQARCSGRGDCRYLVLGGHCESSYVIYSASDVDSVRLAEAVAAYEFRFHQLDDCNEPCPARPDPLPPTPICIDGHCADSLDTLP